MNGSGFLMIAEEHNPDRPEWPIGVDFIFLVGEKFNA
jgi:hypothetical protein